MSLAGVRSYAPSVDMSGPEHMPDIIEFICSPEFADRGQILYPRQATLLKLIFLQDDLFTEYDRDVLGNWAEGFRLPDMSEITAPAEDEGGAWFRYQPSGALAMGIQPDWERRLQMCKDEGRPWFREVQTIIGRRGSKGYIGGLCGARVMYHYHSKGDPQGHYGVARDKRLQAIVFAGKKEQAKANQWKDIVDVILGAPCFQPYVANSLGESLSVYAPYDAVREKKLVDSGIESKMEIATFDVVPKESTLMAGRGPTSFMQFYDEMAHVVATGANRSAEEVYQAATPSLDQFGAEAFIYSGSSPWQMTGQLYENYLEALAVDPMTHEPLRPEMLMVQLPSWALYEDFQYAHLIPMVPEGHRKTFTTIKDTRPDLGEQRTKLPGKLFFDKVTTTKDGKFEVEASKESGYAGVMFNPIQSAKAAYDTQMRRLERANPDTFRVERLSQWATALNAYLDQRQIEEMFGEWPPGSGMKLQQQTEGRLNVAYTAHGDPSKSGANFGWAIAHAVGPDANGLYHVVFDQIHAWLPSDQEDGRIDYIEVEKDIIERATRFMPSDLTFDQFNSAGMIQRIQAALNQGNLPKRVMVGERTATAPLNWRMAETFKTALNMGLIHAPYHELAELELRFLSLTNAMKVDHQTSGPVQTKDVADAMFNVVYDLIGEQMGAFMKGELANLSLGTSQAGGYSNNPPTASNDQDVFDSLGAGGGPARGPLLSGTGGVRRRR